MLYPPNQLDAVKNALSKYQKNTYIKASAAVVLIYASGEGLFDDFLAIPTTVKNVSTQSFSELILSLGAISPPPGSIRNYYCGAPATQYSPVVFDAFVNETMYWGPRMAALDQNATVGVTLEPF
ncbi:hypothetical protein EI94DRAFT_883565 [Lactarius quietus]|nr:hypothetical protein EI94DRAFT_883565 [Lactarius quietus]